MLTGPDPVFPNPNVNGKKRSGYARLVSSVASLIGSKQIGHNVVSESPGEVCSFRFDRFERGVVAMAMDNILPGH